MLIAVGVEIGALRRSGVMLCAYKSFEKFLIQICKFDPKSLGESPCGGVSSKNGPVVLCRRTVKVRVKELQGLYSG
jgi:hypothetical protein